MAINNLEKTDLVIFDCDGVLIDSEIVVCRIAAEELTRIGYSMTTEQVIERFAGRPDREMRSDIESDWGKPLPADYTSRINEMVERAYHHELRVINGVVEALDALDVPVCVASSSFPEKLRLGLEMVDLYNRFAPNVISATSVAHGKPEPDVFIFAAGWMRVSPKNCLVIEDSTAGVRAGRRAGMRVFGFAGGAHCGPGYRDRLLDAGAELVFDRMTDLPSLVEVAKEPVPA